MDSTFTPLGVLVLLSAVKHLVCSVVARQARRQQVVVGKVTRLVVYPVKSMKGIDVTSADCDFAGLRVNCDAGFKLRDRSYIVVLLFDYGILFGRDITTPAMGCSLGTSVPAVHP